MDQIRQRSNFSKGEKPIDRLNASAVAGGQDSEQNVPQKSSYLDSTFDVKPSLMHIY